MKLQQLYRTVSSAQTGTCSYAAAQENHINLEEYTSTVTSYISKCVDDVVITKTIKSFPNQRAWINGEVRALSRAKKAAFWSGSWHQMVNGKWTVLV